MTQKHYVKGFSRMALTAAAFVALSVACSETLVPNEPGRGGTPQIADGGTGEEVPVPEQPDAGERDSAVESSGIPFVAQKSHILLLIDRSGSMAEPADCDEASCPSRWQQLVGLGVYLAEIKQSAFLGLALFPSPTEQGCSVESSLMVPLTEAPNVDQQIMDVLNRVRPGGRTPLAAAVDEMRRIGGLDDPENDNVLVVLTDGRPNCACSTGDDACERDAAVAAAERLVGMDSDVGLYIVGFGASAQDADETLSAVAAVDDGRSYYQVDTIEDLIGKLYEVAVENAPCTFYLDEWPDRDRLIVWLDDEQVQACTAEPCERGYTYDPTIGVVELHGASCEALRDGAPHNVWFESRP